MIKEQPLDTLFNHSLTATSVDQQFYGLTSLESKFFYDAKFVRVFHHHTSKGFFDDDHSKVMFNLEEGKFSVLKYVNEMLQYKGQYEMLIECPKSYSGHSPGIVWWRQDEFLSLNMTTEVEGEKAKGFVLDLRSTWDRDVDGNEFTGLRKSSQPNYAVFDGSNKPSLWWFSIGAKKYNEYIPCYSWGSEISLWVRIPGTPVTWRKINHKIAIILGFSFFNL